MSCLVAAMLVLDGVQVRHVVELVEFVCLLNVLEELNEHRRSAGGRIVFRERAGRTVLVCAALADLFEVVLALEACGNFSAPFCRQQQSN